MATKSSKQTDEGRAIAGRSNYNKEGSTSLFAYSKTLYRLDDGRLYFRERGGAAMSVDTHREYVSRSEAIDYIATEATDPITGYGYTREQAEQMVDGIDAGKGWRDDD